MSHITHHTNPHTYDRYLAFALELSKRAGTEMMRQYNPFGFPAKTKPDQSAITTVDTHLNHMVIESVLQMFPDHDILAEEGSSMRHKSEYVWVCDPLDGTRQFAMGTPNFAFSIALTHRGRPVVGVIFEPYTHKLFQAVIGKGASMNGKVIRVSKKNKLADSLCFFTSSIRSAYNILNLVPTLIANTKRVYNFACCTVESNLVAAGHAEAVIYANDCAHDFAAVKVIVEEAGGKVTDLWGHEQRYDKPLRGVIVSNGHIHKQLVSLLQSTLKKQRYSE